MSNWYRAAFNQGDVMSMDVAIIDAGGANFASIQASLRRLQVRSLVTSDPEIIANAPKVILPGVGAAGYAMAQMQNKGLCEVVKKLKQPVLGICLGHQLLCAYSNEDSVDCLGVIPLRVDKLMQARITPHMGWNDVEILKPDEPLLTGINLKDGFYFVHGFAATVNPAYTLATTTHGEVFSAIIKQDNFYGVQFHPEKSGASGARLLKNFIELTD